MPRFPAPTGEDDAKAGSLAGQSSSHLLAGMVISKRKREPICTSIRFDLLCLWLYFCRSLQFFSLDKVLLYLNYVRCNHYDCAFFSTLDLILMKGSVMGC